MSVDFGAGHGGVEVYAMPVNDLVEHEREGCACGPTTIPMRRDDGVMSWLEVHHSLKKSCWHLKH